jgi:peptidyl-prolyl cis-trans isomerase A (cyclophilin A)
MNPRVRLTTDLGDMVIELRPDRAPASVADFLTHIDARAYDSGGFWRTVSPGTDNGSPPISIIQGSVADRQVEHRLVAVHETTEQTGLRHVDGAVSVPRGDTRAGTLFSLVICIGDQPALDFGGGRAADGQGFAVFGRIVEGMEVARAIHRRPADAAAENPYMAGQVMVEPVMIHSARREVMG